MLNVDNELPLTMDTLGIATSFPNSIFGVCEWEIHSLKQTILKRDLF
jgi:hypothetical protein